MKYYNTLNEISASFAVKEHSLALGNCEECKIYFHIHPSAELLMVLSGELTVRVPGKPSERICAGQCALIFPFQTHAYDRTEGTEYFRFNFVPSLINSFFTSNDKKIGERSVFPINMNEYLPFLEAVRKRNVPIYKVKGFLYNIAGDFSSNIAFVKKRIDDTILSKVIAYIDANISERITISDTATALGYNEKYLSRTINASAGFGFPTLLATLSIEAARNLLKNTERTVVDIAMECGFGSERNFYRTFKEFTGYTPKDFRHSSPIKLVINDKII